MWIPRGFATLHRRLKDVPFFQNCHKLISSLLYSDKYDGCEEGPFTTRNVVDPANPGHQADIATRVTEVSTRQPAVSPRITQPRLRAYIVRRPD